jgi:hypothetical protein
LQPDSLIPEPSNPQSWNKFSYVRNSPVNFNDPTGHKECDDEKGCGGTLSKLGSGGGGDGDIDERVELRRERKESHSGSGILNSLIHTEIDRRFDPIRGWLPPSVTYEDSEYPTDDYNALGAYEQAGVDFFQAASNNQDNPMTDNDWLSSDVRIDYIYAKGVRNQPPGYYFFLHYMGRDVNNPSNYEANYLNALMTTHPQQVNDAKGAYYDQLMYQYGNSQGAWEFLQMSIGVNGLAQ